MSHTPFANDDYDEEDDDDQQDYDGDDTDQDAQDDESDSQDNDSLGDSADSGAATVANASAHEQEAHRNMLGDALQQLSDQGIDVEALADDAGISSADVDELTHGDVAQLTTYLAQNHPEVLQSVSDHFPGAQNLLSALTGGDGGSGLGGLLNRFLGR